MKLIKIIAIIIILAANYSYSNEQEINIVYEPESYFGEHQYYYEEPNIEVGQDGGDIDISEWD